MSLFVAELIGTMILILWGNGVVACVLLTKSKGQTPGGPWLLICLAWGLAVAFAVYAVGWISGAHINPAVTIAMATIGNLSWSLVPIYIAGQMIGAFIGATLVLLGYWAHFAATEDKGLKLACFSTGPNIRNYRLNLLTEIIGTAMLLFGILFIVDPRNELVGGLAPWLIGFLVASIGFSMGGPTGFAINPARDLAPRIAHAILPIPGKGSSDWAYSWVPIVGPIIGGVLGALLYVLLWPPV